MNDQRYVKAVAAVGLVTIAPLLIGWLVSVSSSRAKAGLNERQDLFQHVRDLSATDEKLREGAAKAIRDGQARLVKELIDYAAAPAQPLHPDRPTSTENPWHDSKHLSILLLGDLRASEAVPALLTQLQYINPRELYGSRPDQGGWHPAAEALSKIGMPAVGPTIEKLASLGPRNKSGELCCWILRKILGVKLGRARLQIAIEETRSETAKANLKAALPLFRTPQEEAVEERAKAKEGKRGRE